MVKGETEIWREKGGRACGRIEAEGGEFAAQVSIQDRLEEGEG